MRQRAPRSALQRKDVLCPVSARRKHIFAALALYSSWFGYLLVRQAVHQAALAHSRRHEKLSAGHRHLVRKRCEATRT
jgi:hypothetical protein